MIAHSTVREIAKGLSLPGATFSVMDDQVSSGVFGIVCQIGDTAGGDTTWWRTRAGDNELIYKAIARPLRALTDLFNEAQRCGFEDGKKEGRRLALEAVQIAAGAFAESIKAET